MWSERKGGGREDEGGGVVREKGEGREDEGGGVVREKGEGREEEEVVREKGGGGRTKEWSERSIGRRRITDEVGYRRNEAELEDETTKI